MADLSLEITAVVLAGVTLSYFSKLLLRNFEFSIMRLFALVFVLLLVIAPSMWLWQSSSEVFNDMPASARWAGVLRSVSVSLVISVCALIMACQRRTGRIGVVFSKVLRSRLRNGHNELPSVN